MEENRGQILVYRRVGMNVARICAELETNQSDLSEKADIDRSYLNKVLKGKNVSLDFLIKIADALNVPLASFFEGLDQCSPSALPDDDFIRQEYESITWKRKNQ